MNKSKFKTVAAAEINEMIIQTYRANEMDLAMHEVNKERYEAMLATLPDGKFKTRIQTLLSETEERIVEVSNILASTESQLPAAEEVTAIVTKIKSEEKAAKLKV